MHTGYRGTRIAGNDQPGAAQEHVEHATEGALVIVARQRAAQPAVAFPASRRHADRRRKRRERTAPSERPDERDFLEQWQGLEAAGVGERAVGCEQPLVAVRHAAGANPQCDGLFEQCLQRRARPLKGETEATAFRALGDRFADQSDAIRWRRGVGMNEPQHVGVRGRPGSGVQLQAAPPRRVEVPISPRGTRGLELRIGRAAGDDNVMRRRLPRVDGGQQVERGRRVVDDRDDDGNVHRRSFSHVFNSRARRGVSCVLR